jgi:hypothetical protein
VTKSEGIPPINVSETCWVYGERKGLAVVQEERDDGGKHVRTLQSVIPWSVVAEAQKQRQKNER